MRERIQKILSARGVASRRKAEEMIVAGRVAVNGAICRLGDLADPETDEILVAGQRLPEEGGRVYILLHKPRGFVTTLSDEKGRKNAAQLVADCGERVYPIGRLDMDSEGLLLFTNDGEFANALMHPRLEVKKTSRVFVDGNSQEKLEKLGIHIVLDGYRIHPPEIRLESADGERAAVLVTIHEGRNRQVRRICAAAGMQVRRLIRIREGSLSLGDLPKGKWRYLTNDEVKALKAE